MNNQILQISPTFLSGAQRLHGLLTPVTFVCAVAGLLIVACAAMRESHVRSVWPTFVKMAIAVWLLGSLPAVGDMLNSAVIGLMPELGWGSFPGGVAQAYRDAIARKWGTQSADPNAFESGGSNGQSTGTTGSWSAPQSSSGSRQLGGALAGHEQAFAAAGAQYGVDPKLLEAITIEETGNGTSSALRTYNNPAGLMDPSTVNDTGFQSFESIDDGIAAEAANLQKNYLSQGLTTIDQIGAKYAPAGASNDPNGTNGGWSTDVSSIYQDLGGTGVLSSGSGPITPGSILGSDFNPLNPTTWFAAFVNALVFLLSVAALGCMMLVTLAQQLLYVIELAISPIFIGLMLIPGLSNLATRFFTSLAALLLWPLGWIVSDLVTRFFLDLLVQQNPSQSLSAAGLTALGGGALAIVIFVVLALWVILSSFVAPVIVSALIITGGSGIARVFASTLGVVALTAYSAARNAGVSAAASAIGGAISGPISIQSGSRMNGAQSFARRPVVPSAATNGDRQS